MGRTFFHFVTIHAFDRRTDGQTDGQTNIFLMANTAVQRGKNC